MADTLPHKIEIRDGEAWVRYQGITYRVSLEYFKLEASPANKTIECKGTIVEK